MSKRVIIGVTGGYASGKTTVADMFAEKGARKIDADHITHILLKTDRDVKSRIAEEFGEEVFSGSDIDRRKLALKVFFDKDKLKLLCGVLHPKIIREIRNEVESVSNGVVVIDAPLLIETGLDEHVDVLVVVVSSAQKQIERGKMRGISGEEVKKILENQMPTSEKIKSADYIINTDSDISETKEGVDKIWQEV